MRLITKAGLAVAAVLALAGCTSAPATPSSSPSASSPAAPTAASSTPAAASATPPPSPTPSSTPTPTPTPTPAAPAGIEGRWCPTAESMSKACFTVTGKTVKTEGGGKSTIVRGPTKMADGGLMYSFVDAPLGIYYPKGTAIDMPAGYELKDLPKQDRIWNGQTVDMYVRAEAGAASSAAAAPSVKGFPAELQGEWCAADGKECFSLAELRSENPALFLSSSESSTRVPGAKEYSLCLAADLGKNECTTAASMFLRYFPAGTAWNCKSMGAAEYGFSKCSPDYTKAHDASKARLTLLPNHQHDADYYDSVPLYRK